MSNYTFIEELILGFQEEPFTYAECGVYTGRTFFQVYDLCADRFADFKCYAFDSFSGFPDIVVGVDGEGRHVEKEYWDGYEDKFYWGCQDRPNIRVIKGEFDKLASNGPRIWYDLVFLDCDLFASYADCLAFFSDKTDIMVLDEYYSEKYPGARVAVDEFLKVEGTWELFGIQEDAPYWERWGIRRKRS